MKKRLFSLVSLVLVVSLFIVATPVSAADYFETPGGLPSYQKKNGVCPTRPHEHNYSWSFGESDICNSCYYERLHETNMELPFISYESSTVAKSEPRKTGAITRTLSMDEPVKVVGRIRNEKNHVWCKTNAGDYIYVDNLVFNFDEMIVVASQLSCSNLGLESGATLDAMFSLFKTGGTLDFKNVNMLGGSNNYYKTLVNGEIIASYTGEEMGNFLYGFIAAKLGMDSEASLRIGGAGASASSGGILNMAEAAFCLATGIGCDSEEDQNNILRGMDYYYTGQW